jgi:thiol-disulfide isomerase/thioredoxin
MRTTLRSILAFLALLAFVGQGVVAAPPADRRPYMLVVYADWCPSCQQLKPTLALLNDRYKGRIRFVRFDITSEATEAKSQEQAVKMGLGDFYEKNHDRTAVVIILDPSRHEVFRTINDYVPEHYEAVLNQQLSAAHN